MEERESGLDDRLDPRYAPSALPGREGLWFERRDLVALKTEDAVYGVVELLGPEVAAPSKRLFAGVEALGEKLGGVWENQHRAQNSR